MPIIKSGELIGQPLNWAVARCEGREDPICRYAPEPGDEIDVPEELL